MSTETLSRHTRTFKGADQAFTAILGDLLNAEVELPAGQSKSVGSGRKTREITNYLLRIERPRDRITHNSIRRLDPVLSVARFLWLMAGSNSLKDIAIYDTGANRFSDDGQTIPGSSFGHRMINAGEINQLDTVISLLRADPNTRRAMIAIYHPSDCGRDSNDIPCLSSLAYHIRDGVLHATHILRSNNGFLLFPHNFFELSLLAEVIARELGLSLGTVSHFALSMHIYDKDYALANNAISASTINPPPPMPEMPLTPNPLSEIRVLLSLQKELLRATAGPPPNEIQLIESASKLTTEYWRQFYYILLLKHASTDHDAETSQMIRDLLCEPWLSWSTHYPI